MPGNTIPTSGDRDIAREIKDFIFELSTRELLNDPSTPDYIRTDIRLLMEGRNIENKLRDFIIGVSNNLTENSTAEEITKANEVVEYIQLVSTGLDSFMEAWKA